MALLFGFAGAAFGQSATGTLTGTVTDMKGLAMTGVNVLVHSDDTGVDEKPVATSDTGSFVVPFLKVGTYDITASQTGFATVQHKNVVLQVGETMRVDFEMPVASQESLVTVTTEVPLLETEKTEQSQNVNESLVADLPVSSRQWQQFVLLTAGVNYDGTSGAVSFHGINSAYNNNSIDGADSNSNYNGGALGGTSDGYIYSSDSIREFQVASSGFTAETGRSAGGSINAVTQSGTNTLHGDLFYNGRTSQFNALDPVNINNAASRGTVATPTIHQQDQWGGSAGGRILKDKLFFFVTDDGYRKVNPVSLTTNQLNPTIDSLTCPTATAAGLAAGVNGPGVNPVPNAAECAAAKAFIDGNGGTGVGTSIGQFPQALRQDVELVKLDAQLNPSNHVSGVADIRDWHTSEGSTNLTTLPSFLQDRVIIGNWTTVIGSNKVNELRYQYSIDNSFNELNDNTGMPAVSLSNLFGYGTTGGGSSWTKEYRQQATDNFSITKGAHQIKFGVDANFILDDARSSSNSGGPYTYSKGTPFDLVNAAGELTSSTPVPTVSCAASAIPGYASLSASQQNTATTNNLEFCDWLLDVYRTNAMDGRTGQHWDTYGQFFDNIVNTYPQTFHYFIPDTDYAGYIQDNWKARPNLTVNYGLRYDVQLINDANPLPNCVSCVLPILNAPGGIANGSTDLPIFDTYTTKYPDVYNGFQPRLGVAWNVKKDTVLRFSAGIFMAKTEGHNVKNAFSGAGESTSNCSNAAPTTTAPDTITSCPNAGLIFPNVLFYQQNSPLYSVGSPAFPYALPGVPAAAQLPVVTGPTGGLAIPNPTFGIRGVSPNLRRPVDYTIDAAFEQRLPGNMNLSISYNYARGVFLPGGVDFNIAPDASDPNYCSNAATNLGSSVGQTCGLIPTKTYDVVNANGVTQTSITLPLYSQSAPIKAGTGIIAVPAITCTNTNGLVTATPYAYSARVTPCTGVIDGNVSDVASVYNGLIVSLRAPSIYDFQFFANYTYSLSTDNGEQSGGGEGQVGVTAINPFNTAAEEGHSGFDTTHRFTASAVYTPSFAKNLGNKVAKEAFDGWGLTTSITAQTGGHYTGMISSSASQSLVISGYTPGSTAPSTYTFTGLDGSMGGAGINSPGQNIAGRIAWVAPGSFVLPSLYNVDLRLTKQFTIKERSHVELRFEAFNLFNSTLVQAVNTTAYSPATPSATSTTCPLIGGGSAAGVASPHASTVTCMVPSSSFQTPTTTSGNLLGARQLQAGIRFEF